MPLKSKEASQRIYAPVNRRLKQPSNGFLYEATEPDQIATVSNTCLSRMSSWRQTEQHGGDAVAASQSPREIK